MTDWRVRECGRRSSGKKADADRSAPADDLDRRRVRRRGIHAAEERLREQLLPVEERLALVGEVAEERALGQADGLGDLRRRRLFEPAGGEQLERGPLQPLRGSRFPTHHVVESR